MVTLDPELERLKETARKGFTKLLVPTEEEVQKRKARFQVQKDVNDFFPEEAALAADATKYELGTQKYPWWKRIVNMFRVVKYRRSEQGRTIIYSNDFWWCFHNKLRIYFQKKQNQDVARMDLQKKKFESKRKPKAKIPKEFL